MKSTFRILLAGAVVLVMVLGAWNVAFAEKGAASDSPAARVSHFFSSLFQTAGERPEARENPQAVEDNAARLQAHETPEAIDTPAASQAEDNSQSSSDSSHELSGTVSAVSGNTVTINGQVFTVPNATEGAGAVQVGDTVKLEFVTNADGTITVREIKISGTSGNHDSSNGSGDDAPGDHHGGSGSGGSDDGGNGGGADDGSGG